MIWDLRINKRIMLCMDSADKTKSLVKAKFLGSSNVVALYENQISIFDVRKPSIIVGQSSINH